MDRRTLLRAVAVGVGAAVMPPGGAFDVAAQATMTADLKAAYGAGQIEALLGLERHAFRLREHYRAARSPHDAERIGHLFADAAQHLAHVHYKGAGYVQGAWWAGEAQHVAQKTRDREMVAVAICRKSIIRAAEGNGDHAARLAETARQFNAGPWAEALADIHRAYGYASNPGQVGVAMRALDDAEAAVGQGMAEGTPRPIQTVDLTVAWQDYHRGNILVKVKPTDADRYLSRILTALPEGMRLTRGSIQIRRAEAAAAVQEFEQAVTLAKDGLAIATEGGTMRDVFRVMRLRNRMGRAAPVHLVRELDDALEPHRHVRGAVIWRFRND